MAIFVPSASRWAAKCADNTPCASPAMGPEENGAAEEICRRLTGDNGRHVVAYGTEGGLFQGAGWSTVVCGPGDIAQAHQPDEFLTVSQLDAGTAFVRALITELAR